MGLGLYVHIPFCKSKCYYCDFCSMPDLSRAEDYLDALEIEATLLMQHYGKLKPETLFIGGGTPTLLEEKAWYRLAKLFNQTFDLSALTEWSVEGNPESVSPYLAQTLKTIGVNRFSMGVQSMDAGLLKTIGRIHGPEHVEKAFEALRRAGFDNLNLDLMTGLPGQTLSAIEDVLSWVNHFKPEHVSAYGLKIEEGTPFDLMERRGQLNLPDEALEREMDHRIRAVLGAQGYEHYEISNYAKPGKACRHNLNYWNCGSYAALGLSAHGYLNGERYENTSDLDAYFSRLNEKQLPVISRETITAQEDEKEWLMLRLRLSDGIPLSIYESRYGKVLLEEKTGAVNKLIRQGWIVIEENHLKLTEEGMDFANAVIVELF
ncbi:radical SAM family heme chaperone HemW [Acidaminobacter hydrogenoformans]|uniref:Heme chaperone HemW n=1 Tax=Acidaminobacter hydrogenoformans DSM 2784 TaxID=1120920 RepID=A0A1G5RTJ2_9FIRM|nr:radical SAM family heme chaperone HemW [Acidaminobacter hydrogenoformans]SCZ77168.1 oxygen-independent coproporphyrinogen-3 oxidase [Acidaminobacter hydrogenoformans DSM 2784]